MCFCVMYPASEFSQSQASGNKLRTLSTAKSSVMGEAISDNAMSVSSKLASFAPRAKFEYLFSDIPDLKTPVIIVRSLLMNITSGFCYP